MTDPTAIGEPSEHIENEAGTDWVLQLTVDGVGRVEASGVPFIGRGPFQVFVDGVLHDRDELAQTAGLPRHRPDGELILAAYERYGDALIPRLRGSFAIAIVDQVRNLATVVRDPVGSHPLFYTQARSSLVLSSSQPALLAYPGVSRRLNRVALADQLCYRWPGVDETYFEALKRVAAGCRLIFEPGRVRVERHWERFDGPVDFLSAAEADRFDERLDRAVRRCFGEGRVGIYLSGGFDSVSIAAVAADYARMAGEEDPLALSLAFPHPECDEKDIQQSVAQQLDLPQELVGFHEAAGPRGLFGECLELNKRTGSPLFNTWMPGYLTLARLGRRQGVRTILTGEGGDEWLNVSPYLTADLIRRGDLAGVVRMARTWHRSFDSNWYWVARGTLWSFGVRPLASAALSAVMGDSWDRNRTARRLKADPPWVAPDRNIRAEQKRRALEKVADARPTGGFYARELRAFISDPLQTLLFEEQHEIGRSVGVRYQHPYWDADLVEHMYRTPPRILTRGNRTKGLVRAAVARRFPALGFESRRKVLAFTFFASLAQAQAKALVPRYSNFSALSDLGVVDAAQARAFLEGAFDQAKKARALAWRLIVLEAWARAQLK